jgi:hypothetical protein
MARAIFARTGSVASKPNAVFGSTTDFGWAFVLQIVRIGQKRSRELTPQLRFAD